MPQGRRKVPFSGKQKKMQQKMKHARQEEARHGNAAAMSSASSERESFDVDVMNSQPTTSAKHNPNRYRLVFKREKDEEIQQRKALATLPYEQLPEEGLEVTYEEVFIHEDKLDMPKRPPWNYSLSREVLEMKEQKYFRDYVSSLESKFSDQELSYFEMNLETWRQLWRVVEFSDIVLQVIDIRYPVYHFSPALYNYITKELNKHMIVVMNKIDLVDATLVLAWQEYFKKHFPMLKIMCFASYAGMILKAGKSGRRLGNLHMAIAGSRHLLKLCEEIVSDKVDLSDWKHKIDSEAAEIGSRGKEYAESDEEFESDDERHDKKTIITEQNDTSYYEGERYRDGILTVGFVGHPNVGKSSFLNAVCGKKVVSVSRTPGHTKHFQTIMLTNSVRLCDCPGLVFPSLVPKAMQVLMGCFPIAQLREPYMAVQYLGERMNLPKILNIRHPDMTGFSKGEKVTWSAYDICEALALKRGFRTAKGARPDTYRAANYILRMALDGRTICLAFYPPKFTREKEYWSNHSGLPEIIGVQSSRKKRGGETKIHQNIENDLKYVKVTAEISESESDEDSESYSVEADSEDSSPPAPSANNKFDLLADADI